MELSKETDVGGKTIDSQPESHAGKSVGNKSLFEETKYVRLGETIAPKKAVTKMGAEVPSLSVWGDARLVKLVDALAGGRIIEVNPVIDVSSQSGFAYPEMDTLIGSSGDESRLFLEALANENN